MIRLLSLVPLTALWSLAVFVSWQCQWSNWRFSWVFFPTFRGGFFYGLFPINLYLSELTLRYTALFCNKNCNRNTIWASPRLDWWQIYGESRNQGMKLLKDIRDYQILFIGLFLVLGIGTRDWTLQPELIGVAIAKGEMREQGKNS